MFVVKHSEVMRATPTCTGPMRKSRLASFAMIFRKKRWPCSLESLRTTSQVAHKDSQRAKQDRKRVEGKSCSVYSTAHATYT